MFIVAILSCKHKKTTSYDLSAFFIQADRLGISSRVSVHIIKVGNTAPCISSHLQVCISVGLMICNALHWWYTTSCEVDDMQFLRNWWYTRLHLDFKINFTVAIILLWCYNILRNILEGEGLCVYLWNDDSVFIWFAWKWWNLKISDLWNSFTKKKKMVWFLRLYE